MKNLLLLISLFASFTFCQNLSTGFNYQVGRNGEYYGASFSTVLKTFNEKKVTLKAVGTYLHGNLWGEKVSVQDFNKFELGFESRNYMILGRDFFSDLNLSYSFNFYKNLSEGRISRANDSNALFSIGIGTKLLAPASLITKYVIGRQSGLRVNIEFDF